MPDVTIHFRGFGEDARTVSTLPPVGAYIRGPGEAEWLWRVDSLLFEGSIIHVYCLALSRQLADELAAAWAAWDDADTKAAEQ